MRTLGSADRPLAGRAAGGQLDDFGPGTAGRAGGDRLGARKLSISVATSRATGQRRCRFCGSAREFASIGSPPSSRRLAGARPDQHAGQRHGPGRARRGGRGGRWRARRSCTATVGDDLLPQSFPAIHAVGRAARAQPRLIDLDWGDRDAPRHARRQGRVLRYRRPRHQAVDGMLLMKKDMGGAANVLALAHMIMAARLPVRLRVLIAAVENTIAGNAFRPGDVYQERKGLTVEIGNTDAEGRLVLADALAPPTRSRRISHRFRDADRRRPGCARRPTCRRCLSNDDATADDLLRPAWRSDDPLWRMPFWPGYERHSTAPWPIQQCLRQSALAARSRRPCSCAALSPRRGATPTST